MEVTLDKKLELIGKIDFFSRFTEADRIAMANMATFQGYAPTEKLIQQNTSNTHLFFIINGTVDIVIDGKLIVSLSGGGYAF
jgi:signal-transduction protein with cAMP-binding, CBS, and nucleotidyltransferase domain